jgi:hypothetical protein
MWDTTVEISRAEERNRQTGYVKKKKYIWGKVRPAD